MSRVTICKVNPAEPTSVSFLQEVESIFDRIKQRAFELFEKRGGAVGNDMDDWLNAERQIVFAPPSELVEKEGSLEVRVAAPGFAADQLKVSVLPESIVVEGNAEEKQEQKEGKIHFCELSQRDLLRRFILPGRIDPEQVYASLQNGILKIVARKAAAVTPVQVQTEKAPKQQTATA
jgi:HSP20 family protein